MSKNYPCDTAAYFIIAGIMIFGIYVFCATVTPGHKVGGKSRDIDGLTVTAAPLKTAPLKEFLPGYYPAMDKRSFEMGFCDAVRLNTEFNSYPLVRHGDITQEEAHKMANDMTGDIRIGSEPSLTFHCKGL